MGVQNQVEFERQCRKVQGTSCSKRFTQREYIDYKKTFSPVFMKDSFRIIMALVAHFDTELHQIDIKTAFLNDDIEGKNLYGATRQF